PTNVSSANFSVTFSEGVSGVDVSDFALVTSGLSGASIISVTPVNGSTYTVAVNTGSGDGTVGLNLVDDDSIADTAGNKLGGTGSGSTYTLTVNTGSGSGTVGLNLVDNDSILDTAGNKLGGTGAGNGNFTGQVYTIDKTAPSITGVSDIPDPFSPNNDGVKDSTTVSYTLSEASAVTVRIFDATNNLVRTLISGASRLSGANSEVWDGKNNASVVV